MAGVGGSRWVAGVRSGSALGLRIIKRNDLIMRAIFAPQPVAVNAGKRRRAIRRFGLPLSLKAEAAEPLRVPPYGSCRAASGWEPGPNADPAGPTR